MSEWNTEFQQKLLAATNFREALALFCGKDSAPERIPKPMSYSDLSRRLGLRSRSHVREIVEGLKPVPKNLPLAFCRALKINATWTRYLELLNKEPSAQEPHHSKWKLEVTLLRQKLSKASLRKEVHGSSATAGMILREPELPSIFAALGDATNGASNAEICARTKLPLARIQKCLETLVLSGAVEKKGDRFFATNPHLIFSGVGGEDYFQQDLARSLDRAKLQLRPAAAKETTLFFNSTFCIRSSDMQRLREELKQTLTRYVDTAENSAGDQIVNLVTCLS